MIAIYNKTKSALTRRTLDSGTKQNRRKRKRQQDRQKNS